MPRWYHKLILVGALLASVGGGSGLAYHAITRDPYVPLRQERIFAARELPIYANKRDTSTQIGTLQAADIAIVVGRNSKETGTGKRETVGTERKGNKTVYIKKDKSFWYKINFDGVEGWVHADLGDPTVTWAELRRLDTLHGHEMYARRLAQAHGASEGFWLDALRGSDKVLHKEAIQNLGRMRSERAIEPLLAFLERGNLPDVGTYNTPDTGDVYAALREIGGQKAIDALIKFYDRHDGRVPLVDERVGWSFYSALAYTVKSDAEARYVNDFLQRVIREGSAREGYFEFWRSSRAQEIKESIDTLERCARKQFQQC